MKGKDEAKWKPERLRLGYLAPSAVLFLGLFSTLLLVWVFVIAERQWNRFVWADVAMDMRVKTAMFHLWFEENITNGTQEKLGKTFSYLDEAISLSDALVSGGKSEHGTVLAPINDPLARNHAEIARSRLARLMEISRQRYRFVAVSGTGSPLDVEFNAAFLEFDREARALEILVEKSAISDQAKARRLHFIIIIAWVSIVAASATGLFRRERRHREAEKALAAAYDDMERKVEVRTAELSSANRKLQEENTDRQRAETSLIRSEREYRRLSAQFRTLLDTIPDSIILISPDQRVVWANKGALAQYRTDPAGRRCYERWHGGSGPCGDCPAARSIQSGRAENARVTSPDGRHWDVRTVPVKPEEWGIEGVIEVASDVTDRVALQAEAIRAGHLASIGELSAGVAHEINSPINGIINYAQILCNMGAPDSPELDIAGRIVKEGDRIADIVRGLLSFARDRKEEKRPSSIEDILSEALLLTRAQMKKEGIALLTAVPSELPEIVANPQQIQQVFMNLISNARYALNQKYSGAHDDKIFEIRGERITVDGGTRVQLTFRDTGTGIPAGLIEKVVEPFFSTKPSGRGTGLGLSVCNGIISDHGGTLGIESVEGEFTCVTVNLPARA
jgi:signal transduction histidine kinase